MRSCKVSVQTLQRELRVCRIMQKDFWTHTAAQVQGWNCRHWGASGSSEMVTSSRAGKLRAATVNHVDRSKERFVLGAPTHTGVAIQSAATVGRAQVRGGATWVPDRYAALQSAKSTDILGGVRTCSKRTAPFRPQPCTSGGLFCRHTDALRKICCLPTETP